MAKQNNSRGGIFEFPSRGLPNWVIIIPFLIIGLGFILGGFVFFNSQQKIIQKTNYDQLASISKLKVDEINNWQNERLGDLRVSAESPFFRGAVATLLSEPENGTLRAQTWERLELITTFREYKDVSIVLPDGRIILSNDPKFHALEPQTVELVKQAAAGRKPLFGDLFRSTNDQGIYIDLAGPILDEHNAVIAVLFLRIDPQVYLFPLLQSWPVPSQSAETLLVRREGSDVLFLNSLRFSTAPALTLRAPLSKAELPSVMAIMGITGSVEGRDYRDVEVVANIEPIPGTTWFMVAKVDRSEIFAEINSLGIFTIAFVVLTLVLLFLLGAYVMNVRQRALYRRLLEAERNYSASMAEKRAILYGIGDGVIAVNLNGQITHLNPVAESLTGWCEEDALGRPLEDVFRLIEGSSRQPIKSPVELVLEEGRIVEIASHSLLINREGKEIPVGDSAAPIRDDEDLISGVVLVFRDETLERQAQKDRALFEDTLSASLDEIYIYDGESLLYYSANRGALRNLGLTLEELQQRKPHEIKTDFTPHAFQKLIQPLLRGQQPILVYETNHLRVDGSTYPAECHLQLIDYYGERVFLEVALDITARRQAQEALLKSEERHRLLADNAHDVIWTMDLDGRLTYVSHSVQNLLGYTPEELTGNTFENGLTPEARSIARSAMQDSILGLQLGLPFNNIRLEVENVRKDGSTVWVDISISGMYNETGAFVGMVGVTRDISERRQAEKKLSFRRSFAELLSKISTLFISLTTGEIDEEILKALAEIGTFMDVDRAFVADFQNNLSGFHVSHEWRRSGEKDGAGKINYLPLLEETALINTLMRDEAIILDSQDKIAAVLDPSGAGLPTGLSSLVLFPLWINQQLLGCVGFESQDTAVEWDPDKISLLHQFSNVVSISFERIRLVREIEKRAVRDELTGVYNRRGLTEIAQLELQRARRYHHALGLIFFDIDYFKQINDTLGHVAGDLVLKEVAARCSEVIRDVDVLCRWGGDEFLVLLPESDEPFTCQVGERLHESICRDPFTIYQREIEVNISVGVSGTTNPTLSLEEILANADESLYAAKQAGRNRVHCGRFV